MFVLAGLVIVVPRLVSQTVESDVMLVAWLGGLIQAAALLLFGWLVLPKRRAATSTVLEAILIGATFCTGMALLWNDLAVQLGLERLVAVAAFEEVIKLLAVAIVFWMMRSGLRGPLDGLIVGFFVGFGFAIVENILYTFNGESVAHAWAVVVARFITQFGTHVVFTGIAGAGLAYLFVTRGRGWAVALVAFATPLAVHLFGNALLLWLPTGLFLASMLLIVVMAIVLFLLARRMSTAYEARHAPFYRRSSALQTEHPAG